MGGPKLPFSTRVTPDVAAVAAVEPDTDLMLRVKDGDAASFAQLLARHRMPVIAFLYRMVQNRAVAEELAQDVFLRVYRARTTYEPTAKFTTWLFRIATHIALNALRDGRNEQGQESLDGTQKDTPGWEAPDRRPTVEQNLIRQSELMEVRRAVESLPPKQRAAVLMHKYHELDYRQIARALDCSDAAVKSLLFRAYENLRARLAAKG